MSRSLLIYSTKLDRHHSVRTDNPANLARGWLRGRGCPRQSWIEDIQILESAACVEQDNDILRLEESAFAQLPIGHQACRALWGGENPFVFRPVPRGFKDLGIGRADGSALALLKYVED